jgi:hypothetical protein
MPDVANARQSLSEGVAGGAQREADAEGEGRIGADQVLLEEAPAGGPGGVDQQEAAAGVHEGDVAVANAVAAVARLQAREALRQLHVAEFHGLIVVLNE